MDINSQWGIIGIGAMGRNLSLNFLSNDFSVSVYDLSIDQIEILKSQTNSLKLQTFTKLSEFITSLEKPRKIMIMLKAGNITIEVVNKLIDLLEEGDIIVDGGNQNFKDTVQIHDKLVNYSIKYIGAGISGGTIGARYGPSIMPGGDHSGWEIIKPFLQKISAKTKDNFPCCQWIGPNGSGHYVKTIHNGIEYSLMELIAEVYDILRKSKLSNIEMSKIFEQWNEGKLNSYLIEITSKILKKFDPTSNKYLLDQIVDRAGQKGTGKWSVISALELGESATLLSSAVFQRFISSEKRQRELFSEKFPLEHKLNQINVINMIENALYLCFIVSYTQGFRILYRASEKYVWNLNLKEIAMIWTNGCIIRSKILFEIVDILGSDNHCINILASDIGIEKIKNYNKSLREIAKICIENHISAPTIFSTISYIDGLTSNPLPANLIQAQRDFFGAHGYQRLDDNEGETHRTDWSI